jgi:tetratricopeptide (TPR) repeat protein
MKRAQLVAGSFLTLHILAAYWFPFPLWGADMLAYYPTGAQGPCVLFGAVLIWTPSRKRALTLFARLFQWHKWDQVPTGGLVLALSLGGMAVFVSLKSANALLGDGYLYLNELPLSAERGVYRVDRAPVIFWLVAQLYKLCMSLDHAALQSYQIYSYSSGFLYLVLVWPAARLFARRPTERWIFAAFLLTPGFLQIFCGYVETYALLLPMILLYVMSGYSVLHRSLPLWVCAGILGLLVALHLTLINLAPSLCVVAFWHWRTSDGSKVKALGTALSSLVACPVVFLIPLLALDVDLSGYLTSLSSSNLLPIWSEPDYQIHIYHMLAAAHFTDFLNLQLLIAPVPLMVLFLLPRVGRDVDQVFFLSAALFPLLSTFIANPEVGTFRDWDALSLAALPVSVWAARSLGDRFCRDAELQEAGLMLCGVGALHVLLWMGLNANPAAAEARFIHVLERSEMGLPGRAYGWEMLAVYYKEDDRGELSIAALQRAFEANPNHRYRVNIGDLYARSGRFSEAADVYEKLLSGQPDNAGFWTLLGEVYFQEGREEDSIEAFNKAIELDPAHVRAYFSLCLAYNKMGRYRDALAVGGRALGLDPDIAAVHYELLRAHLFLGDTESARRAFEVLVRIAPDRARAIAEVFE